LIFGKQECNCVGWKHDSDSDDKGGAKEGEDKNKEEPENEILRESLKVSNLKRILTQTLRKRKINSEDLYEAKKSRKKQSAVVV